MDSTTDSKLLPAPSGATTTGAITENQSNEKIHAKESDTTTTSSSRASSSRYNNHHHQRQHRSGAAGGAVGGAKLDHRHHPHASSSMKRKPGSSSSSSSTRGGAAVTTTTTTTTIKHETAAAKRVRRATSTDSSAERDTSSSQSLSLLNALTSGSPLPDVLASTSSPATALHGATNAEAAGDPAPTNEDSTSPDGVQSSASSLTRIAEWKSQIPTGSPDPLLLQDLEEVITLYVDLGPLASRTPRIPSLSESELRELEVALEFPAAVSGSKGGGVSNSNDGEDSGWRDDWSGNLAYLEKDIYNPQLKVRRDSNGSSSNNKRPTRQSLLYWTERGTNAHNVRLVYNLLRHVYHMKETPDTAKRILCSADPESIFEIERCIRRVSLDPHVLREDGWTTRRSTSPEGATGGPHLIGDKLRWQGSDAVVIAYVHDPDIGDLWKALWIDNHELLSFDLEAEELLEGKRKWERRQKQYLQQHQQQPQGNSFSSVGSGATPGAGASSSSLTTLGSTGTTTAAPTEPSQISSAASSRRPSTRNVSHTFTVKGIEYGIVLCGSYAKGARQGVYWPARVMHASEVQSTSPSSSSQSRRSMSKQKVDVVFLAPYWNANDDLVAPNRSRRVESLSESSSSAFDSGPLLQLESIDANETMIKEYPETNSRDGELDMSQLRMSFRFTGLPKAALSRFIDSHRLAMSLRRYAKQHLVDSTSTTKEDNVILRRASAGLFETHPLTVQAALYPSVVLNLPFSYILSQLSRPINNDPNGGGTPAAATEPTLKLHSIVEAMKPPYCWGCHENGKQPASPVARPVGPNTATNEIPAKLTPWREDSAESPTAATGGDATNGKNKLLLDFFVSDMSLLQESLAGHEAFPPAKSLLMGVGSVLSDLSEFEISWPDLGNGARRRKLGVLMRSWIIMKGLGEETVSSIPSHDKERLLGEWRKVAERMYKAIIVKLSGTGNGTSVIISDPRCNEHRTSEGCLERRVRLPAALRGAKLAAGTFDAGNGGPARLIKSVPAHYVDFVEQKLLQKAHSSSYLKRMKDRCSAAKTEEDILVLTDDSAGQGGEDTRGSAGTWMAAVVGVAAAVAGVDMIFRGDCLNVFCATRPPGHHAGRSLHSMKAVSNGFCILNPVACAAIYAVTPLSDGGLGLKRVCVIDIDVHHGNGTQDILCSTYDPRFLYISMHAGGSDVNGRPENEESSKDVRNLSSKSGIYPGRCGDTSPHRGVLNLPLGLKVTSQDVGSALLTQVTPAVDAFAPDLIIVSAGFDAHKSDPMGLGGLSAEDFAHVTDVICSLAFKSCSGRVLSVLEGGYGIPCCRPQKNLFLPKTEGGGAGVGGSVDGAVAVSSIPSEGQEKQRLQPSASASSLSQLQQQQQQQHVDLGADMPDDMDDQVPYVLQRSLEKCQVEGFVECVQEHVKSLIRSNALK